MEQPVESPRLCLVCGTDISHKRSHARYCGARCSKRAQRHGIAQSRSSQELVEHIEPAAKAKRLRKPDIDDLAALVIQAASLEQSFRFAAARGERRFRPMCRRLAESLQTALEREGLT